MFKNLFQLPRRLRRGLSRPIWKIHHVLGLFTAIPLIIISLTGAILVRYDWVEAIADPQLFRKPAPGEVTRPLKELMEEVVQRNPSHQPRFIELPGNPTRNVTLTVETESERRQILLDPISGDAIVTRALLQGARRWLLRLHDSFFLSDPGEAFVGFCGLLLLASALTGLWIHRGAIRSLFRFRLHNRVGRIFWGELHRQTGVWSLTLLAIWALTGMLLTLPAMLRLISPPPPAPELPARYDWQQSPAIEAMLDTATKTFPEAEPDFLILPLGEEDPFSFYLIDRSQWFWAKFKEVKFDGRTGEVLEVRDSSNADPLEKLNTVIAVLHFGHQGGALMRWIWFLLGTSPAVLAASGIVIWRLRKQRAQ